jgi:hypothetical protein
MGICNVGILDATTRFRHDNSLPTRQLASDTTTRFLRLGAKRPGGSDDYVL